MPKTITRESILDMDAFGAIRHEKRKELIGIKKNRRVSIGSVATAYFENYDTMWWQIHEMLWIERGGVEQIEDEINAYQPLVPNGHELVATVMFEIDNPKKRKSFLSKLGGIEETVFIQIEDDKIIGVPEDDVDRTTADGKASAVQFIHFNFNDEQINKFKNSSHIVIGIDHPQYKHMTGFNTQVSAALSEDFD